MACLVALNAPSIDLTQHRPSSSEAERVVFSPHSCLPISRSMRGDRHIAAVASYLRDAVSQGPLGSIYPHAASLPSVITAGRSAIPGDPEQVLSLRPDAVITWAWFSEALVAAGLPVLAMRYESGESPEHNAVAAWAEISRVANRAARGGELIARYDRERELALRYVSGVATAIRPRAVFIYKLGGGAIYAAGDDNSDAVALREAGADNLAPHGGLVSEEQLLLVDPDTIVLGCFSDEANTPAALYSQSSLTAVTAVRNRRVYKAAWNQAWMDGGRARTARAAVAGGTAVSIGSSLGFPVDAAGDLSGMCTTFRYRMRQSIEPCLRTRTALRAASPVFELVPAMRAVDFAGLTIAAPTTRCAHGCRYCSIGATRFTDVAFERFAALVERFVAWRQARGIPEFVLWFFNGNAFEYEPQKMREVIRLWRLTGQPSDGIATGGLKWRAEGELRGWLESLRTMGIKRLHFAFAGMDRIHDRWNARRGDFEYLTGMQRIGAELGMCASQSLFTTKNTLPCLDDLIDHLDGIGGEARLALGISVRLSGSRHVP